MSRALVLSPARTSTHALLEAQAADAGLTLVRLGSPVDVPAAVTEASSVHVYGGPRWASAFASVLDLALLEPADDWLPDLERSFTHRSMTLTTAAAAGAAVRSDSFFAKPPREKSFDPAVHTAATFAAMVTAAGLVDEEPVLISEPVEFGREYRLLVLDGKVQTGSRYLSWGALDPLPLEQDPHSQEVLAFAAALLEDQVDRVPAAFTLDVGYAHNQATGEQGWAVVEANMAWFSNIYACDPAAALDVVLRAAGPSSACSAQELAFTRRV